MALPLHLLPSDVQLALTEGPLIRDFRTAFAEIPQLPIDVERWHTYEEPRRLQDGTWGKVFREGINRYTVTSRYKGYGKTYQAEMVSKQPPYHLYTLTPRVS